MIKLGVHDPDVPSKAIDAYLVSAQKMLNADLSGNTPRLRGDQVGQFVSFTPLHNGEMKVAEVQQFLEKAGFFPDAVIDGICGYRTQSAIRLFQEYARNFHPETLGGYPDGVFGPQSTAAAREWIRRNLQADWSSINTTASATEHTEWLRLLTLFREKSLSTPSPLLRKANTWTKKTATIKPAQWNIDPTRIHLIGIRYGADKGLTSRTYDDLFILLLNGLVFKFKGSTDPGSFSQGNLPPFLVPGQHRYEFGWHGLGTPSKAYHALRPAQEGVLILRTRRSVTEEALDPRSRVETNSTINIHWGGKGRGIVGTWSQGCQVITGDGYLNHHGTYVDCSAFSALTGSNLGKRQNGIYQTKGAYSVLTDLVTALSGRSPENRTVFYTLLYGEDLLLIPQINLLADQSRARLDRQ